VIKKPNSEAFQGALKRDTLKSTNKGETPIELFLGGM